MIRFSIFGIPVAVQPFFWVGMALLGGATYADSSEQIFNMILFILAGFISILVHELGHALTGLRLGGGSASIELTAFGGLAYSEGGRFTRSGHFWMIAAGPGAGFALFLAILLGLAVFFGPMNVLAFAMLELLDVEMKFSDFRLIEFLIARPYIYLFLGHMLWINLWWGVLNLLPVMPLDGGQITNLFVRPQRRVHQIGMVAALGAGLFGYLQLGSWYMPLLFGFLAWQNYQSMKATTWR